MRLCHRTSFRTCSPYRDGPAVAGLAAMPAHRRSDQAGTGVAPIGVWGLGSQASAPRGCLRLLAPEAAGKAPKILAMWRRERDSNPRGAVNPHTLSRRAT